MARFLMVLSLLMVSGAPWATSALVPGTYTYRGDHGVLILKGSVRQHMTFEMETQGANGHSCFVNGRLKGNQGEAKIVEGDKEACRIQFTQISPHEIEVTSLNSEICSGFCGARASFDGTYLIPPKACGKEGQKKRRKSALSVYGKKDYKTAERILSSLLTDCSDFISWIEVDEIKNEMALSQYHQGNPQACLATLSTTRAGEASSQEDLVLPPADEEAYQETAKRIWFNKGLCSKAVKGK